MSARRHIKLVPALILEFNFEIEQICGAMRLHLKISKNPCRLGLLLIEYLRFMDDSLKPKPNYNIEIAAVFGVAFELGFIIALPIVALGLLGKWLDQKYGVSYFVFIGIALALLSSGAWLYGRLSNLAQRLQNAAKNKKGDL